MGTSRSGGVQRKTIGSSIRIIQRHSYMSSLQATVLTREGCHLCVEACELLQRYGFVVELIDIDADADLQQKYTSCVPVVVIDDKERFRGRINETLLRRLVKRRP